MNGAVRQAVWVGLALAAGSAGAGEPAVILDTDSFWRCHVVRGTELVRKASGELAHLSELAPSAKVKVEGKYRMQLREVPAAAHTPAPPRGWADADFDDGDWPRERGPFYAFLPGPYGYTGEYRPVQSIRLRGKFHVGDPAAAAGLTLSLDFHGGAVVGVNGRELTRAHLPACELTDDTPAEDYPIEAYVAPNGNVLRHGYGDPKAYPDRYKLRTRRLKGVKVPADMLRRGTNVLTVELRRSPAPEVMFTGKVKKTHLGPSCWWPRVALERIRLKAPAGSGVAAAPPSPAGPRAWNRDLLWRVRADDRGDANEPLRAVSIRGVRNGSFSGKLVVGPVKPPGALRVEVGDLTGPGVIPASAVQVRHALPDGLRRGAKTLAYFDTLETHPPAAAGGVQPVWFTVHVPPDAKAGVYEGKATISVGDARVCEAPIRLEVIGWSLPAARDFTTHVGLIQSPETVAMKYGAPMWSKKHWELIDRSFDLLGQVATRTVYITMIRRTHFGNPHSMVRWRRAADGRLEPDLSVAEKYIDAARKRLGRISVVGLYCWEPLHTGHYEHKTFHGDRKVLISVVDPDTGKLTEAEAPAWGTPECRAFWTKALGAVRKMLAARGLADAMMLGISADYAPSKTVVDDLAAADPKAKWIAHSHVFWSSVHGRPVGYLAVLWGMFDLWDPAGEIYGQRRFHGWRDAPFLICRYPRNELRLPAATPARYRTYPEQWMTARGKWLADPKTRRKFWSGTCGFGRVGADFWPVLKDGRGRMHRLLNRYPDESSWGQLTLTFSNPAVLGPGRDGAAATVRLEMLREGLQEAEARVFIEKALLDPARRKALGEPLAARCQAMLDERVRDLMRAVDGNGDWLWYISSSWRRRSKALYSAAAEVAEAMTSQD